MSHLSVIREVKITLAGERQEFPCRLLDRSETHAVVFYPIRARRRVGTLVLPKGTESYGYFWRDRPYNVYHWVTPNGRTLGFYVNLSDEVVLRRGEVRWRDLALDLLFSPDGSRVQILDEEEVSGLPAPLRMRIAAARAHVLTHRDELLAEVRGATEHLRTRVARPPRGKESARGPRTP